MKYRVGKLQYIKNQLDKFDVNNLATDLHEDKDVAQEHPELVDQMVKIIYQEHVDNPLFPITMPMERGK